MNRCPSQLSRVQPLVSLSLLSDIVLPALCSPSVSPRNPSLFSPLSPLATAPPLLHLSPFVL